MTAPAPLWTLDDVARFLRLEELDRARLRQRLADLVRYQGFPAPLIRGTRGGETRYDPDAIAAWLRRRRGDDVPPAPPSSSSPSAPPATDFFDRDFDTTALERAVKH